MKPGSFLKSPGLGHLLFFLIFFVHLPRPLLAFGQSWPQLSYWGVATAAFQTEGQPAASDWRTWTQTPGRIEDGSHAQTASDFWNRWPQDFDLAQTLGANMFRFSLAWERIEPTSGHFERAPLLRYAAMCRGLRSRGMEPLVTLNHFVLPSWLVQQGGVLAQSFPDYFSRFTQRTLWELKSLGCVPKFIVTLNEPMVMLLNGYAQGIWPPGKKNDMDSLMKGAVSLAKAHIRATGVIRRVLPHARVSVATHWRYFQPKHAQHPLDALMARILNSGFNEQFVKALITGNLHFTTIGAWPQWGYEPLPQSRSTLDYFALNYYGRVVVETQVMPPFYKIAEGPGPKTDLGWEIFPKGLAWVLKDVFKLTHLPILVTENGLADAQDSQRPAFIREHLGQLLQSAAEKIPVMGYLHWSLTDNFEWASGLTPRFGLVEVDFRTQTRTLRPSFFEFQRWIGIYKKKETP